MKNEKTRKCGEMDTRKEVRMLKLTHVTIKIRNFSSLKMAINKNEKYLSA